MGTDCMCGSRRYTYVWSIGVTKAMPVPERPERQGMVRRIGWDG